jgi:hypothetical protein
MNREQRRALPKAQLPGDVHIPQEFQALRGTQQRTGPLAQAAVVEGLAVQFIRKVGLEVDVARTDTGWVLTVTKPVVEVVEDGVSVGP